MAQTTNEAPTAGTVEAGDAKQRSGQAAQPCPCSIPHSRRDVKTAYEVAGAVILPHLMSGRGNAKKRRELLAATGLRDRAFRHGVEALRRSGVVVCSDERGYFLPATLAEVQGFIRQEEARARSTFFTLRAARQLAALMQAQGEQLTVEGV